jgi:hypothetical protein
MLTQWLPLSCSSPSMNDTLADFTLNINHAASQGQGFYFAESEPWIRSSEKCIGPGSYL